jgi:acyl carrier protein
MEYKQWHAAHLPKTAGTWNLYKAVPRTIDFFLIMSSAVNITGNAGQSNYAAACAYQDALAHYMRADGIPAYTLNVGAVADTGFVAEHSEVAAALRRKGFGTIETADMLATLNHVLRDASLYTVDSCQCAIGLVPKGNEPGLRTGVWATDSKVRHLYRREDASRDSSGANDIGEMISSAKTAEGALNNTNEAIIRQLSKLIGIAVEYISDARSLDDYGVDSLVAVELRNWIGAFLLANVPILVLRKTKSIKELAHLVVKESRLVLVKAD